MRDLPETGRLTGRGDTLNLERLIAAKPDLVIDFGTINDTYRSLADRVQAQTGIPYLLIDGTLREHAGGAAPRRRHPRRRRSAARRWRAHAEETFAAVDTVLARVPADKRPRVYLARGPEGLETGTRGSINTEIIERVGGINVVEGLREKGGIANVSPEQVIAWAPDTIITLDRGFHQSVNGQAGWSRCPPSPRPRLPRAEPALRLHRRAAVGEPADRPHLAAAHALSEPSAGSDLRPTRAPSTSCSTR